MGGRRAGAALTAQAQALQRLVHLESFRQRPNRHGSERVIEDCRDHVRDLKKMQKFEFIDTDGKDCGLNVREKARQLVEILGNDEQLTAERNKARANKNKFTGTCSEELGFGNKPQHSKTRARATPSEKVSQTMTSSFRLSGAEPPRVRFRLGPFDNAWLYVQHCD